MTEEMEADTSVDWKATSGKWREQFLRVSRENAELRSDNMAMVQAIEFLFADNGLIITEGQHHKVWSEKLDRLKAILDDKGSIARNTMAQLAALVKALEFYADPNTYHAILIVPDHPCGAFVDDFSEDHGDDNYKRAMPGKLARQTLHKDGNGNVQLQEAGEALLDRLEEAEWKVSKLEEKLALADVFYVRSATPQIKPERLGIAIQVRRCFGFRLPKEPMWKVLRGSDLVLNKDVEWEPNPSSRDDEFYGRCRFDTFEEAFKAAQKAPLEFTIKED